MKTAAFYRSFEAVAAAPILGLGFKRQKGRISRWLLRLADGRLYVQFRCNPKYPWQYYSGGSFFTEAFFCRENEKSWDEIETSPAAIVDFFGYLPDPVFERIGEINHSVYQKVAALDEQEILASLGLDDSASEVVQALRATALEVMEMESEMPLLRAEINPNQYYHDQEDAAAWGELMSGLMPTVVAGVRESPRQPFRIER